MKYPNFELIKDFKIKNKIADIEIEEKVLDKGKIFKANEEGVYNIKWKEGSLNLNIEQMKKSDLFKEINKYDLKIEEIDEDDDNHITNWRIQYDVKTTKKKLKEFQKIFENSLKKVFD